LWRLEQVAQQEVTALPVVALPVVALLVVALLVMALLVMALLRVARALPWALMGAALALAASGWLLAAKLRGGTRLAGSPWPWSARGLRA